MKVQEVFKADITRDIPPVIYFHEQDPARLQAEVQEYIVTGGYEEGDPRHRRIADGIHEQFVRLLRALSTELGKPGGPDLPACWISGFFGSGKSSFAKLLGLALDHRLLPNGQELGAALVERDDSPRKAELREAWQELIGKVDSIAVVFDIGAESKDDEHIHSAVRRMLQKKLGYCPVSHHVADYELRLQRDGKWEEFLTQAQATLGKPWSLASREQLAEDHFSEVMHEMFPSRFEEALSWLDARTGAQGPGGASVEESVQAMEAMLNFHAPGKTLFVVVDEVSQYVYAHDSRMQKLQALVENLGQRLRGRVWLLATGQQKLDDELEGGNLTKLKGRFKPRLQVHLAPTNIRDVVHKRLLKKSPDKEPELLRLFEQHRADLRLYGYQCEQIGETDFLEVYPLLPGHVDLLMRITTNLRVRSTRMKGDDHAIRGLLQLLGEVFREKRLGEQPLGTLVTLDHIYDVQCTALDPDVQHAMSRLSGHGEAMSDPLCFQVAKAVALLELISEQEPTTAALVAACLYPCLGAGSRVEQVSKALELLYELQFLSRSDKHGYKIQSSAGQEWARERDSHSVTGQAGVEVVRDKLKILLGRTDRPRFKNRPFPVAAFLSDGRTVKDERLQSPGDAAVLTVDFHYLTKGEDRREEQWLKESDLGLRRDRVVWVSGEPGALESRIRELVRSRIMVNRYTPRLQSLQETKRRLVFDEQSRLDALETEVESLISEAFTRGCLYFRARKLALERAGTSFPGLLSAAGEEALPILYQHFIDVAVTDGELRQLLEPTLSGVDRKFLAGGLGLLELDSGRYLPTCKGEAPRRILDLVKEENGVNGSALMSSFGGPPCGYPSNDIKACVVALLRGNHVCLRSGNGDKITSVIDPGVQELFRGDRGFRQADILPAGEQAVTPRERVAIAKFFRECLNVDLAAENEPIREATFQYFPGQAERMRTLEGRLVRLPRRPKLPTALENVQRTLERCMRSPQVEDTVKEVHKQLATLREGLQELGIHLGDLTEEAIDQVKAADRIRSVELEQLRQLGLDPGLEMHATALEQQLEAARPWRDIGDVKDAVSCLSAAYREVRQGFLERQAKQAQDAETTIELREGYDKLSTDQRLVVLRPIRDALCDTTAEAISPALSFLRDSVPARIREATEEAHRKLDDVLAEVDVQVVQFRTNLRGRELATREDVESLLADLRERLLAQLKADTRIRLV